MKDLGQGRPIYAQLVCPLTPLVRCQFPKQLSKRSYCIKHAFLNVFDIVVNILFGALQKIPFDQSRRVKKQGIVCIRCQRGGWFSMLHCAQLGLDGHSLGCGWEFLAGRNKSWQIFCSVATLVCSKVEPVYYRTLILSVQQYMVRYVVAPGTLKRQFELSSPYWVL